MEEDIKILEETINHYTAISKNLYDIYLGKDNEESKVYLRKAQALENLIKGYRKLEEQLEIDKAYGLEKAELQKELGCKILKCKIVDKNINLNLKLIDLKKNSIPKSKIKEKIDELEKYIYKGENAPQDFLQYRIKAKIQALQELMEDK